MTGLGVGSPLGCRVLGHRPRFWAEGETMRWRCERCGEEGAKEYGSDAEARRYAAAFDREDRDRTGDRSPLSLLPLRLARRGWRRR